jgi:hypothetical protein
MQKPTEDQKYNGFHALHVIATGCDQADDAVKTSDAADFA